MEQHKSYRPEDRTTSSVGDAVARGQEAATEVAREASGNVSADLEALRADLKHLRQTVADLAKHAGSEATRTAKDMAHDLADKGVHAASAARDQARTAVGELESMARRNPLGALAGALFIGVLIGMSRRR